MFVGEFAPCGGWLQEGPSSACSASLGVDSQHRCLRGSAAVLPTTPLKPVDCINSCASVDTRPLKTRDCHLFWCLESGLGGNSMQGRSSLCSSTFTSEFSVLLGLPRFAFLPRVGLGSRGVLHLTCSRLLRGTKDLKAGLL